MGDWSKEKTGIIHNILEYKNIPGVWAVFGKNEKGDFEWLNVAATNNIGGEIAEDLTFMMLSEAKRGTLQEYKNYWGEKKFEYRVYNLIKKDEGLERRKALWAHIADNYSDLRFVCLVSDIDNKDERFGIERYMAQKYRVKYWRDGNKKSHEDKYGLVVDDIVKEIEKNWM